MKITIAAIFLTKVVFFNSIELSSQSSAGSSGGDKGKGIADLEGGGREGGNRRELAVPLEIDWVNVDLNIPGLDFPLGGIELRLQKNKQVIGVFRKLRTFDIGYKTKPFAILDLRPDDQGVDDWYVTTIKPKQWLEHIQSYAHAFNRWDIFRSAEDRVKLFHAILNSRPLRPITFHRQDTEPDEGQDYQHQARIPHAGREYQHLVVRPPGQPPYEQLLVRPPVQHPYQHLAIGPYGQPYHQQSAIQLYGQPYYQQSSSPVRPYIPPMGYQEATVNPDFFYDHQQANKDRYENYHHPQPDIHELHRDMRKLKIKSTKSQEWGGESSEPAYNPNTVKEPKTTRGWRRKSSN